MTADRRERLARSYLASEEKFQFIKDLQSRNMVVPVVGNFGGPKAIRAVGKYLKDRDAIVSAFYLSNVEQYLRPGRALGQLLRQRRDAAARRAAAHSSDRCAGAANATSGFGLASELGNMAVAL